ncbi:LAGLIDADG-2 domain-containing protein [Candidatus Ornithobacterium hominis]|nr:LAGLIDADG-2 domain-containing protein [Candidatus Ornithobacterium hominis]
MQIASKIYKEVNFKQNLNLKNYIKKNGENQVMLTLHSQGKRKRLMLGAYIRLNFGQKNQSIKGNSKQAKTINSYLNKG